MLTRFRGIAAFLFGCGMISFFAPAARAQQATPLPKDFDTKGEYVGMAGAYMKCILNGNPDGLCDSIMKSKVKVTGTATADFLDKGTRPIQAEPLTVTAKGWSRSRSS